MKRAQVVEALSKVLKPGTGGSRDAARAARRLPRGLEPAFVRRVFEKLLGEDFALQIFGATLPDEYVKLARAVLAKKKTAAALFLTHVTSATAPAGFRDAVKTLIKLETLTPGTRAKHLKAIAAQPAFVTAAQTTVAVKGVDAWLLVPVLAYDGSPESADVLLPLVREAIARKGATLDFLAGLLDDRALASPAMRPIFAALDTARGQRAELSKVGDLADRFGAKRASFRIYLGFESNERVGGLAQLTVGLALSSLGKPEARIFGSRTQAAASLRFNWVDGKTVINEAGFPGLKTLDQIPRWLKAVADTHRCTWNRQPVHLTASVRGRARARLLEWLLSEGL